MQSISRDSVLFSAQSKTTGTKKRTHVYVLAEIKTLRKNSATISVEPFKVIAFDVAVAAMINFPADVISFY